MKITVRILLFSLLLITSCKSQDFTVNYETIEINIPGTPNRWLKHNEKFYCYFTTDNDKYSSVANLYFYILDEKGKLTTEINVPKKLHSHYNDLYVKNDSIFTTTNNDKSTFYLDEKNKIWVETKKGIDLFYEDNDYTVYSLDFGEWGGVTWFKDTKTNKQYEVAASNPVINKLENIYYLTEEEKILKISDPQKMEISNEPYDYKKAVLNERYFRHGSGSLQGVETIYENKDNDNDFFNQKFLFGTSFIANNTFYSIYRDSISMKIGTIENHKLVPVYEFKNNIIPLLYHYDWRNRIQNNSYQTIQFSTKNKKEYGIIEINGNLLTVTTFKNAYKEPVYGEAKIKDWFEKTFDFYYNNFDNLYINEIDSLEQTEKATNITQRHNIGHYLLEGKNVETPRIYRKKEIDDLKLNTLYYYTTKEKRIELIEFEWGENQIEIKSSFKQKFDWISDFLTKKLGKVNSIKQDRMSTIQTWKRKDLTIELRYEARLVSVRIYKG